MGNSLAGAVPQKSIRWAYMYAREICVIATQVVYRVRLSPFSLLFSLSSTTSNCQMSDHKNFTLFSHQHHDFEYRPSYSTIFPVPVRVGTRILALGYGINPFQPSIHSYFSLTHVESISVHLPVCRVRFPFFYHFGDVLRRQKILFVGTG